jgi:CheY-like chemotaxis protein
MDAAGAAPAPAPPPPTPPRVGPTRNPYAFAPEGDATVRVDLDAAAGPPPAAPPGPLPDPLAPADEKAPTVILVPGQAADAPDGPSALVLVAVRHAGRRAFVLAACQALGLAAEVADETMAASARVRAGGVDVLVADADLPEVGGAEVIRVAQASAPAPVYTILLAPPEALADPALAQHPPDALVARPLRDEDLRAKLAAGAHPRA